MVVIAPSTPNLKTPTNLRSQSNPRRPPLLPSERDKNNNSSNNNNSSSSCSNVAIAGNIRRSKSREVSSRYLSTSSSSSTSGSSSSTMSNSSYFSSNPRRCPSPNPSKTINSSIPAIPMMNSSAIKRSQSAERRRPSTPRARGEKSNGEMSAAAKLLISSSKSLAVSFQGRSFSGDSSKKVVKNPLPSPVSSVRKGAPEMKHNSSRTPWPGRTRPLTVNSFSRSVDFGGCEGNKSVNGSATKVVRALQESLIDDCKLNGSLSKDEIVQGVRDDNSGFASLGSESIVSDRESVSSESNSGSQDSSSNGKSARHSTGGSRMIVVPAKYWQETNNFRTRRVSEPGSPMARNGLLKGTVPPKSVTPKRLVSDSTGAFPRAPIGNRGISSPLRGSVRPSSPSQSGASLCPALPSKPGSSLRPSSPSKMGGSLRPASPSKSVGSLRPASPSKLGSSLRPASPSKVGPSTRPSSPSKTGSTLRSASPNKVGTSFATEKVSPSVGMGRMASPSRVRNGVAGAFANTSNGMPSHLCFGADVRRVRVADNRLGDAHLLRILHNRHLQWRFVNARAESSMHIQKVNAERSLYNAWKATSDLREAVSSKRKELRWLKQNLKLMSILKGQMSYLEEWAFLVKDHCSSLSGAMESLKASTLRLPLIGGAKADIQDVKDAICSAADVMHAMASSICSLLEKVEEVNSLMAEVASITSKEQFSLNQCKDILSMLAAMQVKDCSLRAHRLQLKCAPSILAVKV